MGTGMRQLFRTALVLVGSVGADPNTWGSSSHEEAATSQHYDSPGAQSSLTQRQQQQQQQRLRGRRRNQAPESSLEEQEDSWLRVAFPNAHTVLEGNDEAPPTMSPLVWTGEGETDNSMVVPMQPVQLKDQGKIANVVGGSNASPGDAPYFALILSWNGKTQQWESSGCGGTLISSRHVLTAGHCAAGRNAKLDAVYVHAYQPFWGNPGVPFHYSKVVSYTLHPQFDDGPNKNDVAIITLQKAVDLSKFAPVVLAPSSLTLRDDDTVTVYGFGRQAYKDATQVKTLQTVDLPFISRDSCRDIYGSSKVLDDMVCAGYTDGGKDACNGDSGGPLVVDRNGQSYQYAVVSWGEGCGFRNKPGVYTATQPHMEWIQSTVCNASSSVKSPLCGNYSGSAVSSFAVKPTPSPVTEDETKFRDNFDCTRKQAGQSCEYGGQCCSGMCQYVSGSRTTTKSRVCLNYS